MACEPLIPDEFVFPRRADNRPGLPRIGYRIARYGDFREAMLRAYRCHCSTRAGRWSASKFPDCGTAFS